ncbi:SCP2 sterol-binding domain-containing protein [Aeromicrobium sp. Leaf350]|uniref:SCP2 sterol-binding domain-containing protein n=1 Tax=Aeromicrobium sp. Leaf350 TaxID=2876565 RepID=UPI001E4CAFA7|nr:SCP2 sterol-binding domain-containing protein [Aeromicrobium sp. Leaf350]
MGFQDSTEVMTYIGGIFEKAYEDPTLADKLRAAGIVLKFDFKDPDVVIVIDMANGTVTEGVGDLDPDAEMTMSSDVGNAYWQGKVNLPLAMAKGKIKVGGNVAAMLKVAPLSKQLFGTYVERLKADGRDDLLVA